MSSGFKSSDLFIEQSQKNPSSPHTPTTSVGLNSRVIPHQGMHLLLLLLQFSLLAEHITKCSTSVHFPVFYLLLPSKPFSVEIIIHACM